MAIAKVSMFAITAPCTADIGYLSKEENLANARLIASAPDLLEALIDVERFCPVHEQDRIRALRAQIEGR